MHVSGASFNTHIYNIHHVYKLLKYLERGIISESESLCEKNMQKARAVRDIINARSNIERPCALTCMSCRKFHAQSKKSYCKGCELNLNVERYNLKKAFAHLKTDVCDICNRKSKVIVLEHDHVTGHARSWCCNRCNTTLALITNNPTGFILHCHNRFGIDISSYDFPEKHPYSKRECCKEYVFNSDGTCQA